MDVLASDTGRSRVSVELIEVCDYCVIDNYDEAWLPSKLLTEDTTLMVCPQLNDLRKQRPGETLGPRKFKYFFCIRHTTVTRGHGRIGDTGSSRFGYAGLGSPTRHVTTNMRMHTQGQANWSLASLQIFQGPPHLDITREEGPSASH